MENTSWFVVEKRTITWEFSNPIPILLEGPSGPFFVGFIRVLKTILFRVFWKVLKKCLILNIIKNTLFMHTIWFKSKKKVKIFLKKC